MEQVKMKYNNKVYKLDKIVEYWIATDETVSASLPDDYKKTPRNYFDSNGIPEPNGVITSSNYYIKNTIENSNKSTNGNDLTIRISYEKGNTTT